MITAAEIQARIREAVAPIERGAAIELAALCARNAEELANARAVMRQEIAAKDQEIAALDKKADPFSQREMARRFCVPWEAWELGLKADERERERTALLKKWNS